MKPRTPVPIPNNSLPAIRVGTKRRLIFNKQATILTSSLKNNDFLNPKRVMTLGAIKVPIPKPQIPKLVSN